MGLSNKKRAVLAKLETVANTDATPSAANDGVLMADVRFTPLEAEFATRKFVRAGYGGFAEVVSTKYGKLEIDVEIAGYGSAGPATPTPSYDALLQICGLAGVVTASTKWDYTPISSSIKTATVYVYIDGRLHKFTGCRANLKASGKANQFPLWTFEIWGNYVAVADAALVSPTLTAFQAPLPFNRDNTTLTTLLGSATGICLESWDFDLGNVVVPPNGRVNCTQSIDITDRATKGSLVVEGTLVSVKDWFANVVAGTQNNSIDFTHGTTAGNRVQFSSSRLQIKPPSLSEEDNVELMSFETLYNPLVPGDEFKITIL